MADHRMSSVERTFATPELLEQILLNLLDDILLPSPQEDPRSVKTHACASKLHHLLRCSEVNRIWKACMHGSKRLQCGLFLRSDHLSARSWEHESEGGAARREHNYLSWPSETPILNSILQVTFPSYHFRYWRLSLEASGNKHCAYLIITKRDFPSLEQRTESGQGKTISSMLLAQPPPTALEATIWEERDETKDYLERTTSLRNPILQAEDGLTMDIVHRRVGEMFREHADVAAIKLTTL